MATSGAEALSVAPLSVSGQPSLGLHNDDRRVAQREMAFNARCSRVEVRISCRLVELKVEKLPGVEVFQ